MFEVGVQRAGSPHPREFKNGAREFSRTEHSFYVTRECVAPNPLISVLQCGSGISANLLKFAVLPDILVILFREDFGWC